ncbi:MAG: hypothetical protein LBM66_00890, partial [Bifidobacteriaceae bacterium]|nr:hypothetical protein [Bifidobacteriaceae bacterium]
MTLDSRHALLHQRTAPRVVAAAAFAAVATFAITGCTSSATVEQSQAPASGSASALVTGSGSGAASGAATAAVASPVPSIVTDFTKQPGLTPAVAAKPYDGAPWMAMPRVVLGSTLFTSADTYGDPKAGMWTLGAGVTASNLNTGKQLWHVDYSDASFALPNQDATKDVTSDMMSDGSSTVAVMVTRDDPDSGDDSDSGDIKVQGAPARAQAPTAQAAAFRPAGAAQGTGATVRPAAARAAVPAKGDSATEFTLVTIDAKSGKVLGSVSGSGSNPYMVAMTPDAVVYTADENTVTAVSTKNPSQAALWTADMGDNTYGSAVG